MNTSTTNCQNCKNDFTIEPEDFEFYEKINVPAPTFCPECRLQRRMLFRNERTLYKRVCDLTGQSMVTIFAPEKPIKVYQSKAWWSDDWDPYEYGMDYDPTRPFFEQFRELQMKTPWMNLIVGNDLVNSEYINHASSCKDCYLIFNADGDENTLYSSSVINTKDSMDVYLSTNSELCYETISAGKSRVFFSETCEECMEVYFSKNCVGCTNCFGCVNLRKKSYCIFNEQYTKEEYEEKIKSFRLDSYEELERLKKQANDFWLEFPVKYLEGYQNVNVTGNYVSNSKNSKEIFYSRYVEDSKFCSHMNMASTRDCYDITEWGQNIEMSYEGITIGDQVSGVKFCFGVWGNVQDVEYSMMVGSGSKNCFGCCNLKKAEYCILNKQYSKEEYFALKEKIIEDMNNNPYVDAQGRIWKYGEFFPYDLSMFGYNESYVVDFFPLTKEQALFKGFSWREETAPQHAVTLQTENIPDSIHDVDDSILQQVLGCVACNKAFKIVTAELQLLRRFGLPIPRKCPNCRHIERMNRLNPPKLWERTTEDGELVLTSYSPENPQKILSEKGYQNEVM